MERSDGRVGAVECSRRLGLGYKARSQGEKGGIVSFTCGVPWAGISVAASSVLLRADWLHLSQLDRPRDRDASRIM